MAASGLSLQKPCMTPPRPQRSGFAHPNLHPRMGGPLDKGKLIHLPLSRLWSDEIDAVSVVQFPLFHRLSLEF